MLNKKLIKEKVAGYNEIGQMTIAEYVELKRDMPKGKLPSMNSIYKYFGKWSSFKEECFNNPSIQKWRSERERKLDKLKAPDYCEGCLKKDDCKYLYDLDKCDYYQGNY